MSQFGQPFYTGDSNITTLEMRGHAFVAGDNKGLNINSAHLLCALCQDGGVTLFIYDLYDSA